MKREITRFLDEEERLKQLPARYAVRELAYAYLSEKFAFGRDYTEREVNAILLEWHTFGDHATLRRGLIDGGWLCRTRDGGRYWKNPDKKGEDEP